MEIEGYYSNLDEWNYKLRAYIEGYYSDPSQEKWQMRSDIEKKGAIAIKCRECVGTKGCRGCAILVYDFKYTLSDGTWDYGIYDRESIAKGR